MWLRISRILEWMKEMAPTSTPRVGWFSTSRSLGALNSLATMAFWIFPPDRLPMDWFSSFVLTMNSLICSWQCSFTLPAWTMPNLLAKVSILETIRFS